MKASEVYREAARIMEGGEHWVTKGSCCWAIQLVKAPGLTVGNSTGDEHCRKMKQMYAPNSREAYWMGSVCDDTRILALCFMAAIAADEESAR